MTVTPDYERKEPVHGSAAEVLRDATLPYNSTAYALYEQDWEHIRAEAVNSLPWWWHATFGATLGFGLPQVSSIAGCFSDGSGRTAGACLNADGLGPYLTCLLLVACFSFWVGRRRNKEARSPHQEIASDIDKFFEKERERRKAFNE